MSYQPMLVPTESFVQSISSEYTCNMHVLPIMLEYMYMYMYIHVGLNLPVFTDGRIFKLWAAKTILILQYDEMSVNMLLCILYMLE